MASFQLPAPSNLFCGNISSNTFSSSSSCPNTTIQFFLNQKLRKHTLSKTLSCRAAKDNADQQDDSSISGSFDRRDILLGLGGLYGTTALGGAALAKPSPIIAGKCSDGNTAFPACATKADKDDAHFCPPESQEVKFRFPKTPLRIRRAAHELDDEYVAKFEEAMRLMKELPQDDPRSFAEQAAIHSAYCDYSYEMEGNNNKIDVHFSWLFFPFHRWYLYFYEKILGKLIGDDTFALPYWNWDEPGGMKIPTIFDDCESPLYDKLRNPKHRPCKEFSTVDLNFSNKEYKNPLNGEALIKSNLYTMYKQMVSNSKEACLFFGKPYRAGDASTSMTGAGSIENIPHTNIHIWTGDPSQSCGQDMGRFFSAGRDPLFYSHHANVDRMWNIWKTLPGKNRKDLDDPDWLDSSFLFYDENRQRVRVTVRDCLDTKQLGYLYDPKIPTWINYRSVRKRKNNKNNNTAKKPPKIQSIEEVEFPIVLLDGLVLKVNVPRPEKSRSPGQKEDEEEILEIDFEYKGDESVKFNVHLNDEDEENTGAENAEFAGGFTNVPFAKSDPIVTSLSLGITDALDELGANDDDAVVVTIIPRDGKVTIQGLKITLGCEYPPGNSINATA